MNPNMKHLFEVWFIKECPDNDVYEELKKDVWAACLDDVEYNLKSKFEDYTITVERIKKVF